MFEMNWLTICLIMRNVTALVKTILQVFPEPRVEPALLPLTFARPSADVYGAQWNTRCTDPDRPSRACRRGIVPSRGKKLPTDCSRHAGLPAGGQVEAWIASREAGCGDAETARPGPVT